MSEQYDSQTDIFSLICDQQTSQFEEKVVFKAITEVIAEQLQDLNDVFYQLLTERSLNAAVGEQLDVLGRILVLPRNGEIDVDYRRLLKAKAGINASTGSPATMIPILKLVTDSTYVGLQEISATPATVSAVVNGNDIANQSLELLEQIAAAGINLTILSSYGDDTFGFEGSYNSGGFGEDTDANEGGAFATLIEV